MSMSIAGVICGKWVNGQVREKIKTCNGYQAGRWHKHAHAFLFLKLTPKKETLPSLGTLKGQAEDRENILQT